MTSVRLSHGTFVPSMEDRPFGCPADRPPVTVTVEGRPQGKGRPRSVIRKATGAIGHYTPTPTRTYEGLIRAASLDAVEGIPRWTPYDVPVRLVLSAIFEVPKSWSQTKQAAALTGLLKPGVKPDLDNITKAWKDGMRGVIYRDDCLVVEVNAVKAYGPSPLVVVTVRAA